jgi:hypothetical protein
MTERNNNNDMDWVNDEASSSSSSHTRRSVTVAMDCGDTVQQPSPSSTECQQGLDSEPQRQGLEDDNVHDHQPAAAAATADALAATSSSGQQQQQRGRPHSRANVSCEWEEETNAFTVHQPHDATAGEKAAVGADKRMKLGQQEEKEDDEKREEEE